MNVYQSDYTQKPLIFELIRNHENEAAQKHLEVYLEEINLKGWMDDTPLHIACLSNNFELVRYLVEHGAAVNARRSGVYVTPLCWSESVEISRFLLEHGATVNDDELYYATRTDKPEIVELLLSSGAILNPKEPPYLVATSIDCLQKYLDHGILPNKTDFYGKTVLHHLVWMELPEVFDFAYKNGGPWSKAATMHKLYYDAKVRGRKKMVRHIETHYPHLISYESVPVDPQSYEFQNVRCMRAIPGEPDAFIALSGKTNLLRYSLKNQELFLEGLSSFATPASANFTFDKKGNLVLPTGENKLLVIDPHSFQIIHMVELPEQLLLGQLTWLPKRNCFVSAYSWEIFLLDEHFNLLLQIHAEDGTGLPKVNADEGLLAFYSYDQVEYFNLYSLDTNLEITFIETFFKEWENTSSGFAFNDQEFAVSFPETFEYYNLVNGSPNKLWEIAISGYPSKHHLSHIACIGPKTMVLGKGKTLLFIDLDRHQIIREETLDLASEISNLYTDDAKKYLFVSTESELKLVSLQ